MLIGRLFEPVKGALLFLGSGMTFVPLKAWGHKLSSRLKLIWQIGVAISSAIILRNIPSKLSDPGGLSLLTDNIFFTSSTLKITMLVFHNLKCFKLFAPHYTPQTNKYSLHQHTIHFVMIPMTSYTLY